jgi:hypothetical protein
MTETDPQLQMLLFLWALMTTWIIVGEPWCFSVLGPMTFGYVAYELVLSAHPLRWDMRYHHVLTLFLVATSSFPGLWRGETIPADLFAVVYHTEFSSFFLALRNLGLGGALIDALFIMSFVYLRVWKLGLAVWDTHLYHVDVCRTAFDLLCLLWALNLYWFERILNKTMRHFPAGTKKPRPADIVPYTHVSTFLVLTMCPTAPVSIKITAALSAAASFLWHRYRILYPLDLALLNLLSYLTLRWKGSTLADSMIVASVLLHVLDVVVRSLRCHDQQNAAFRFTAFLALGYDTVALAWTADENLRVVLVPYLATMFFAGLLYARKPFGEFTHAVFHPLVAVSYAILCSVP